MGSSRAVAASLVGAVLGGVVGYFFFTEHGQTLRRQMESLLDDVARELNSFRSTVQKAAGVASETWKTLNEALGGGGQEPQQPAERQSSRI